MKKFFITVLCMSLFVTVGSVWASGDDNQNDNAAKAKKENVEKKACCEAKAEAKAGETKACCAEKKACCEAKAEAKTGETKACCAEKKANSTASTATGCTNKEATSETKSCGKKVN
ncbi:MAG: hypothetical protein FWF53_07810 [Candidatus Azobacteroides sp.]|nr:hypothetical protein [Candidatus Azobacteroides sp.]